MLSIRQTGVLLLEMAALGLSILFDGEIELMKRTNILWQNMSIYKDYNWDDLCNNYDPVNGKYTAEELWKDLGIGAWFDDWLMTYEDKDYWANTMDNEVNKWGKRYWS